MPPSGSPDRIRASGPSAFRLKRLAVALSNSSDILEQLIYVSTDTRGVTNPIRAADILAEARRNNVRDKITGVLTFTGGQFVQILEGHPDRLEDLLARLAVDPRHRDLKILARRTAAHRDFQSWDMVSPRLVRSQIDRLNDLLSCDQTNLEAFVDLLAEAVHRQASVLTDYGFDPRPDPEESRQAASPTA